MLAACNIANLDLSGVALMCVSSVDMKTPAHIHLRGTKAQEPGTARQAPARALVCQ
jgi:hypothetical protein